MTEMFKNKATALPRPDKTTLMVQSSAMAWQDCGAEGFWIKPLYEDPSNKQRTWLMKVDAGASAPAHVHAEVEQIYVIDGSFTDGINTYVAGDFAIRAPEVSHGAHSENGALVMLVYAS